MASPVAEIQRDALQSSAAPQQKSDGEGGEKHMPRKNKMCGVYMIASTIDSRIYVGSSIDIAARWTGHKKDLSRGNHHSKHLQRFVDKHGMNSVFFCILTDLLPDSDPRRAEQVYIDTLKPEFNVCRFARSCLGVKRTAESKERNRIAQIKRDLNGPRNPMYGTKGCKSPNWGKKHKPETIAKMIANHRPCAGKDNPNYGKKQKPETTIKANETKRTRRIERYGSVLLKKGEQVVFEGASLSECASFISVNPSSIRLAYKKGKLCKGFKIQKTK